MVRTVHGERLAPVRESRCACHDRMEYEKLLDSLDESGKTRATLIRTLSSPEFARTVYDPRAGHDVTVWWLIVRGNLDHEIHHRGQLSLLLNLVK